MFGVLVLAGTTGLGGGFLRDVLIGATPPAALEDWRYLMAPVAAGLVTFAFHPAFGRMEPLVNVFDAFGLALFCVTGALKALEYDLAAAVGGAHGHGHRHRRRDGPRRARRPGAGRVPAASSTPRPPSPGPRSSSSASSTSTSAPSWSPSSVAGSAWSGGCSRSGGTGRRRCRPARQRLSQSAAEPSRRPGAATDSTMSSNVPRSAATGVHSPVGTVQVSSSPRRCSPPRPPRGPRGSRRRASRSRWRSRASRSSATRVPVETSYTCGSSASAV